MENLILTYGLSDKQKQVVKAEYPEYELTDVTDQAHLLLSSPCMMKIINTDEMAQDMIFRLSLYREENENKINIPCYIWADTPVSVSNTKLWQEHLLHEHWKEHKSYQAYISDGIVDLPTFCKQEKRLLFILRDMNHHTGECSLCDELAECGSGWKTWNNVARWVIALLDGNSEYPMQINTSNRAKQMRRVAVMNIKKEGGGKRSNRTDMATAVKEDRDYLLQQIYLYCPDMVICCGFTSSSLIGNADLLIDGDKDNGAQPVFTEKELRSEKWKTKMSERFNNHRWWYHYIYLGDRKIPLLSFCHPQTTNMCGRRGHEELFEPLYRDMVDIGKMLL